MPPTPILSAIIITKNEARHVADCIASIRPLTNVVTVFDSISDDGTQELARAAGAQVIERVFDSYAGQRQAALDQTESEWVLFVDADERVTPELAAEIRTLLTGPKHNGYWIPRRNFIVGHEMRAGGFYPDYQLRLMRRTSAHYVTERAVHEIVDVGGSDGHLNQPLVHYNYQDWAQFHRKQWFYATYEAKILAGRGIRPRPHNFVLQPLREFKRRFITLQGWKDGVHGLRLAVLLAWYYGFIPYWLCLRGVV